MGRIKSLLIKRTAEGLIREENSFNEDFDNNKKLLGNITPSKSTRNKIAGQITRNIRAENIKRKKLQEA